MNKTYLHISITHYNSPYIKPEVYYYRDDGVHPVTATVDRLTPVEANQLMWELVKLGAKNRYTANMYNNSISTREVTFWGVL